MLTAIPIWQGRVSPVLDVAQRFLLVDPDEGEEMARDAVHFESSSQTLRVQQLLSLGVEKIVCGAVSKSLSLLLASNRMEIVAGICGDVDAVLKALRSGTLDAPEFAMPGGCCRGMDGRGAPSQCGQFRRRRRGQRKPI